jgi:hypothetical protein
VAGFFILYSIELIDCEKLKATLQNTLYTFQAGSPVIQQEVLFSREGFDVFGGDAYFYNKLYYLGYNILMNFRLFDRFYAYPGLQLSVLLDTKVTSNDSDLQNIRYDNPNRLNLSAMAGLNYALSDKVNLDM